MSEILNETPIEKPIGSSVKEKIEEWKGDIRREKISTVEGAADDTHRKLKELLQKRKSSDKK